MFSFFAHPVYFYGLLVVLLAVSLGAIFSLGQEDKKIRKKREEDLEQARSCCLELGTAMENKELEHKETIAGLEKSWNNKEIEFNAKIAALEKQLLPQEQLKSELAGVKEELDKTKKEFALSNEMYNGLKGQYDELEEKFNQLFEEFLKEQKKNLPGEKTKVVSQPQVSIPKIPNLRSSVQEEESQRS